MRPSHPFEVRHRDVWGIALPATVAFIAEPLAGIVDLAVIGRLGDAGMLAGLVLAGIAIDVIAAFFFFLRLGTGGLVAQAIGARDPRSGLDHIVRALGVALIGGAFLVIFSIPINGMAAQLLVPAVDARPSFDTYLAMRLFSMPFALANFAFLGWFYGRAEARTGMALQFLMHGANIVLSIGLVYGLGWGVFGVGLGTLLAQAIAALAGLLILVRQFSGFRALVGRLSFKELFETRSWQRLFALSRDLMVRSLAIEGAFAFFISQVAHLGSVTLAATAILLKFQMVSAFFLDGQAQAAEQLAGKAVGANYEPAFRQAMRLSLFWGFVISGGLFVFWLLGGPLLIGLMTTAPEVQAVAEDFLLLSALGALTGVMPFVMDGVMAGATLNTIIRNGMLAALAAFLASALLFQALWGLVGLWLALHVFYLSRGVIFLVAVRFKRTALFAQPVGA